MGHFLVDKKSKQIVNVIVVDEITIASGWRPPDGHDLVKHDGDHGIGWTWHGTHASDPNEKPPAPAAGPRVIA